MQTAKSIIDGVSYVASDITEDERVRLKGNLVCPHCGESAFYKRASPPGNGRRGRAAHFASRHNVNCSITREVADADDGESLVRSWEERDVMLVVRIAAAEAEDEDEGSAEPMATEGERTGRSANRTLGATRVIRGPQRLLHQLVNWPSFKTSPLLVRLPDREQTELPVHSAFVRFGDAHHDRHTTTWHGFWGRMPRLSRWNFGDSWYANFGPSNTDFRIAIDDANAAAIMRRYNLTTIHDLTGMYMILFAPARISGSGRFTADMIDLNHIGVLPAPG